MPVVGNSETLLEAGIGSAVMDSAANPQHTISPTTGSARLLRRVHSAVRQQAGCVFSDRCLASIPGTLLLGVAHHPKGPTDHMTVTRHYCSS